MKWLRNFFLVFLCLLILGSVTVIVRAQTTAETAKENSKKTSDYALPYPGVLPDNILYSVKLFRDKAFELLIVDPVKKSDFYLLQGDKRLAAGETLINYNKTVLGEQTISKGEKYMILSVENITRAKKAGRDVRDLTDRLKRSLEKHDEVISLLQTKTTGSVKQGLTASESIVKNLMNKVALLRSDHK